MENPVPVDDLAKRDLRESAVHKADPASTEIRDQEELKDEEEQMEKTERMDLTVNKVSMESEVNRVNRDVPALPDLREKQVHKEIKEKQTLPLDQEEFLDYQDLRDQEVSKAQTVWMVKKENEEMPVLRVLQDSLGSKVILTTMDCDHLSGISSQK